MTDDNVEFVEESDSGLEPSNAHKFSEAVLHSTDWTVETIISQLNRGNIEMSPRFQRRDAWSIGRKSAFVESLVLGLPVPQIVLAEKPNQRGKYIVLDGKQRLLSLLQFTGNAQGTHNAFRLSGLDARTDLTRKSYESLQHPAFENDLNAFLNYTIRTVVIRNWPNYGFLHLVFLRLNTGSVKLSPQELRQAMFPGEFSDEVDDRALSSENLITLLGRSTADPRMRDVELLVRYLAFHFFLPSYAGRMKDFLDNTCNQLNERWDEIKGEVEAAIDEFELATGVLLEMFGQERVARKSGSRSFNRAIFDALVFYAANPIIREEMSRHRDSVIQAYDTLVEERNFLDAVESDTAGVPNTAARISEWGYRLRDAIGIDFEIPQLIPADTDDPWSRTRIVFAGFGI